MAIVAWSFMTSQGLDSKKVCYWLAAVVHHSPHCQTLHDIGRSDSLVQLFDEIPRIVNFGFQKMFHSLIWETQKCTHSAMARCICRSIYHAVHIVNLG